MLAWFGGLGEFPVTLLSSPGGATSTDMYFDHVCVSDGQSNRGTGCGERAPTEEGQEVNVGVWADSTSAVIAMQLQVFLLCI